MGISSLVQESLLVLLMYDQEHGRSVCNMVGADLYDGICREAATRGIDFWVRYGRPPAEHVLDLFEEMREADPEKVGQVDRLYTSLQETREGINPQYVLDQISGFIREQQFREALGKSVDALEQGRLDEAEAAIRHGLKQTIDVFHSGTVYGELDVAWALAAGEAAFPTGIKELDNLSLGPSVGEFHLFSAPYGRGKSWWLLHLAKMATLHRHKVLYVTLEMDERRVAQRFLQTTFALTRRQSNVVNRVFRENSLGKYCGCNIAKLKSKSLKDVGIEKWIADKMRRSGQRTQLMIRQFPPGQLTVQGLAAYLENLESRNRFVPTLVVLDYIKDMKIDARNYRIELGRTATELRGLAVERKIALATAMQVNREFTGRQLITGQGIGEDYSLMATADVHITYNQTKAEHARDFARLWVDKGRNEQDKFMVLITQQYKTGQFCLSSTQMRRKYWRDLDTSVEEDDDDEDRIERPRSRRKKK